MLCYFKSAATTQVPCTRQDVCEGDQVLSWSVDYDSIFTLDNWIIQLDLYCIPLFQIGLIGSILCFGAALACLVIPHLGDKYGRLTVFYTTIILQIPFFFLAIFTRSLTVLYFWYFYLGVCQIGRY
jgi:MFS family permease